MYSNSVFWEKNVSFIFLFGKGRMFVFVNCLSLPRFGSSRDQQRISSQIRVKISATVFHFYHGASPFWSMFDDFKLERESNLVKRVSSKFVSKIWDDYLWFVTFQDEFKRVISILEDAILATDLAVYFKRRRETFDLVESSSLDFVNDHHKWVFTEFLKVNRVNFFDLCQWRVKVEKQRK